MKKLNTVLLIILCVATMTSCSLWNDDLSSRAQTTVTEATSADTESVPEEESIPAEEETAPEESEAEIENDVPDEETPFARHGALSVDGADLVDSNGAKYQLYGMSTHGIAWFPQYVNLDAFKTLRNEWNTNCVRLAMYTHENSGYCTDGDKNALKAIIKNGVDYATQLGMYVIIDWHVLNDRDPNKYKDEAVAFFEEISKLYADYDNVLYEICNEPNGSASWDDIKSYANTVIPVIRNNDANAVVIVGTPTWSQDIDKALASPLDCDNVMYALHFYAATHTDWLRNRVQSCVDNGLPVFISEFGICDSSGNGANDLGQANEWKTLIEGNNISYFCWNFANKDESSSVIKTNCTKTSGWTDDELRESGLWIKKWFQSEVNP